MRVKSAANQYVCVCTFFYISCWYYSRNNKCKIQICLSTIDYEKKKTTGIYRKKNWHISHTNIDFFCRLSSSVPIKFLDKTEVWISWFCCSTSFVFVCVILPLFLLLSCSYCCCFFFVYLDGVVSMNFWHIKWIPSIAYPLIF